jgi:hypothetical protein
MSAALLIYLNIAPISPERSVLMVGKVLERFFNLHLDRAQWMSVRIILINSEETE